MLVAGAAISGSHHAIGETLPSDTDSDGVPDEIEFRICRSALALETLELLNIDTASCRNADDFTPEGAVQLILAANLSPMADEDADGLPGALAISLELVRLDPATGAVAEWKESFTTTFEPNDGDARVPTRPSGCVGVGHLSGLAQGPYDQDGDGFAPFIRIAHASVCHDARKEAPGWWFDSSSDAREILVDRADADPTEPADNRVVVRDIPMNATFGPDLDGDTLPSVGHIGYVDLSFDRSHPLPTLSYQLDTREWDAHDKDAATPLPIRAGDLDGDGVFDSHEPYACLRDASSKEDGRCSMGNYDPPFSYPIQALDRLSHQTSL